MTADIQKLPRTFLPEDFTVTTWDKLEPYFKELLDRPLNSKKGTGEMVERYQRA